MSPAEQRTSARDTDSITPYTAPSGVAAERGGDGLGGPQGREAGGAGEGHQPVPGDHQEEDCDDDVDDDDDGDDCDDDDYDDDDDQDKLADVTQSYQQKIGILETKIIDKELEKGYNK